MAPHQDRLAVIAPRAMPHAPRPAGGGPANVQGIVERLQELSCERDRVSIDDMVDAFGTRGYGPFLLVPALLEITPIGVVPGVPTMLAALIALFAIQIVFGRPRLWVPQWLGRRSVAAARLSAALQRLKPTADRLDRWFGRRLQVLTRGPFVRIAALGCMVLACVVPMAEVLPFLSSVPMIAIALFGLALLVRDGALMIGAIVATVAALGLLVNLLM